MQPAKPRIGRVTPGTFAAVIRQFMASPAYTTKAESTRQSWGRALRLAEEEGGLGGCSVQVVRPAIIQSFLDALADMPGKQSVARTALKALEAYAVVRDLVPMPFMTGTTVVGSDGGHEPWPDDCVAMAEQHARPDLARAVILALNLGQRGSDVVRMRPTDIEEKIDSTTGVQMRGINVTQQKTGRRLWVPFIYPEFEPVLNSWERRPGPFVLTPDGRPFTRPLLSTHWNRERDSNPELKPLAEAGLVLHGLRATAVVRARKRGLTDLQISNVFGMSEAMVARYSRLADQGDMAMAAVHFLCRTGGEQDKRNVQNVTTGKIGIP
jgi:integrase